MAKARTIGVGMDYSQTSKSALRWTIDNLIDRGDHLILIHVLSPKTDFAEKKLWEDTGSRLFKISNHLCFVLITVLLFFIYLFWFTCAYSFNSSRGIQRDEHVEEIWTHS